jgi:hypothetical protein
MGPGCSRPLHYFVTSFICRAVFHRAAGRLVLPAPLAPARLPVVIPEAELQDGSPAAGLGRVVIPAEAEPQDGSLDAELEWAGIPDVAELRELAAIRVEAPVFRDVTQPDEVPVVFRALELVSLLVSHSVLSPVWLEWDVSLAGVPVL